MPLTACDGGLIDHALVIVFSAPASFTGEDCVEFHTHGGRAVVAALLNELAAIEGFRPAEAGEFTQRAFINGKIDLTGAEALADLIDAETEAQRRLARVNADGRQRRLYEGWRDAILRCRAYIEAELDFSDEGDVPGSVAEQVWRELSELRQAMLNHVAQFRRGQIIREGFRIVLLGAPNAGKSALINALADRDVAIVSDEAGTTRDLIEVALDLDGLKVLVTDTAGIREVDSKVERIGIDRALARAEDADLVLYLEDMDDPRPLELPDGWSVLRVGSKADLVQPNTSYDLCISTVTGEGMQTLTERLTALAAASIGGVGDILPTQMRHVSLITKAAEFIGRSLDGSLPLELRAEELRLAADTLGSLTGAIGAEELLGVIFSRFCIGK